MPYCLVTHLKLISSNSLSHNSVETTLSIKIQGETLTGVQTQDIVVVLNELEKKGWKVVSHSDTCMPRSEINIYSLFTDNGAGQGKKTNTIFILFRHGRKNQLRFAQITIYFFFNCMV